MAGEHILIVDDERAIQTTLPRACSRTRAIASPRSGSGERGAARACRTRRPTSSSSTSGCRAWTASRRWPRSSGVRPETAVVMISGHGTIETAVKATKLGAYDFIEKPLSLEKTLLAASRALDHARLERENRDLREQLERGQRDRRARAALIEELRQQIAIAAPTNGRVLIHGENGSGQGAGGPRHPRPVRAARRALRRGQLRGHPRGADRVRALRPRARAPSPARSRGGAASSSSPTAARSSSTRSAT